MTRKILCLLAVMAMCLCAGSRAGAADKFEICAGNFGGTTYQFCFAVSEVMKKVAPRYELLPVETTGIPASIMKASENRDRMLMALGGISFTEALKGKAPFPKAFTGLKLFGFVTQNVQTLITYNPGIRALADVKGKRVGLMNILSSNGKYEWSIMSRGIEGSSGMKPAYMNWTGLQSALLDGTIDVSALGVTTNANGPWMPVSIYSEMVASRGAPYFLGVDEKCLKEAGAADDLNYVPVIIPKGAIAENVPDRDVTAWEDRLGIGGFDGIPDDVAYTVTKILCENQADMTLYTPAGRAMSLTVTVPSKEFVGDDQIHPGALRYYREKGLR